MSDWNNTPFFSDDDEIKKFFNLEQESEPAKKEPVTREAVQTRKVQFEEFEDSDLIGEGKLSLELLYDIPIEVSVRLGSVIKPIGELTNLQVGNFISLEKLAGQWAEILVGDELLARGEVVVTVDKYSVVIKEVVQPREKLESIYQNLKTAKAEH